MVTKPLGKYRSQCVSRSLDWLQKDGKFPTTEMKRFILPTSSEALEEGGFLQTGETGSPAKAQSRQAWAFGGVGKPGLLGQESLVGARGG